MVGVVKNIRTGQALRVEPVTEGSLGAELCFLHRTGSPASPRKDRERSIWE